MRTFLIYITTYLYALKAMRGLVYVVNGHPSSVLSKPASFITAVLRLNLSSVPSIMSKFRASKLCAKAMKSIPRWDFSACICCNSFICCVLGMYRPSTIGSGGVLLPPLSCCFLRASLVGDIRLLPPFAVRFIAPICLVGIGTEEGGCLTGDDVAWSDSRRFGFSIVFWSSSQDFLLTYFAEGPSSLLLELPVPKAILSLRYNCLAGFMLGVEVRDFINLEAAGDRCDILTLAFLACTVRRCSIFWA